jgi:hypothetical protein
MLAAKLHRRPTAVTDVCSVGADGIIIPDNSLAAGIILILVHSHEKPRTDPPSGGHVPDGDDLHIHLWIKHNIFLQLSATNSLLAKLPAG